MTGHYPSRVPPFGNPRIDAYLRLPSAYRSLSRPSSAISALASTLRSCSLDLASSRCLSLPKTIENDNQLRLFVVCFFPVQFSRCVSGCPASRRSYAGRCPSESTTASRACALPPECLKYQLIVDPSKRYRNQSFCCQTPLARWPTLSTPCVVVATP